MGGVQATSFAGTTEEQISKVLEKRVTAGQQQTRVLKRGKRFENTAEHFAFELSEDLSKFGLVEMTPEELGQKNQWRILVEGAEPADIKRGKTFFGDGVSVKATTSKVRYTKGGVSVKSVHAVAVVKNTGATPLAYRIVLEPLTSGRCEVKGTRGHNAVALMPGEEAEIVVCAGSSGISVRALEVMEVSPVGFYYLSMLPPQAQSSPFGRSHVPPRGPQCGNVPAPGSRARSGRIDSHGGTWWIFMAATTVTDCSFTTDTPGPTRLAQVRPWDRRFRAERPSSPAGSAPVHA